MKDPTNILWEMAQSLIINKPPTTLDTSGWSLKKGLKIFADPQIKCPNCHIWINTQRIWLVDDNNSHLLGCWKLDGSKVNPDVEIIHSHVFHNKSVCTGDFKLASDSLFLGVQEGRHYHSTERWISQLGHNCERVITIICDECNKDEIYPSGPRWERHLCYYCGDNIECECDMCRRAHGMDQCRECEEWFDIDNLEDGLCENCESPIYRCVHCGENEVDENGELCNGCQCLVCGEEQHSDSDSYCSDHRYPCECSCGCDNRVRGYASYCDSCDDCTKEEEEGDIPF